MPSSNSTDSNRSSSSSDVVPGPTDIVTRLTVQRRVDDVRARRPVPAPSQPPGYDSDLASLQSGSAGTPPPPADQVLGRSSAVFAPSLSAHAPLSHLHRTGYLRSLASRPRPLRADRISSTNTFGSISSADKPSLQRAVDAEEMISTAMGSRPEAAEDVRVNYLMQYRQILTSALAFRFACEDWEADSISHLNLRFLRPEVHNSGRTDDIISNIEDIHLVQDYDAYVIEQGLPNQTLWALAMEDAEEGRVRRHGPESQEDWKLVSDFCDVSTQSAACYPCIFFRLTPGARLLARELCHAPNVWIDARFFGPRCWLLGMLLVLIFDFEVDFWCLLL